MKIQLAFILLLTVLASGTAVAQRTAVHRGSRAAAPAPAPSGESTSKSTVIFKPKAGEPSGAQVPGRRVNGAVHPLFWGWGSYPVYLELSDEPLVLEDGPLGGVQLDVQPWRSRVYVDGRYAGLVEEFSGYYRHLKITAGPHRIAIIEDGYEPLVFEIHVPPGRTTTYRGTLSEVLNR